MDVPDPETPFRAAMEEAGNWKLANMEIDISSISVFRLRHLYHGHGFFPMG
jgi:hypothetical protein